MRAPTAFRRSTWSAARCRPMPAAVAQAIVPSGRRPISRPKIDDDALGDFVQPLAKAFGRLQQATVQIARVGMAKPEEAGAAATDYLRLFGLAALAYLWARMAEVACPRWSRGRRRFLPRQDRHRALLHGAPAAGNRRPASGDHGRAASR